MSKIGRLPITVPTGTTIEVSGSTVKMTGPKGTLSRVLPRGIEANLEGSELKIVAKGKSKTLMTLYGTTRALVNNDVTGVSTAWTKKLELVGTGFRAETNGKTLTLTVGYSHTVPVEAPEGISFKVEKMIITVEGMSREDVGQMAAVIRAVRPPEPYKGKGIKYVDEVIRRKAGKAAAKAGATK